MKVNIEEAEEQEDFKVPVCRVKESGPITVNTDDGEIPYFRVRVVPDDVELAQLRPDGFDVDFPAQNLDSRSLIGRMLKRSGIPLGAVDLSEVLGPGTEMEIPFTRVERRWNGETRSFWQPDRGRVTITTQQTQQPAQESL